MNEEDKLKAIRELNWRARYIKYQETGENKGLLQDSADTDIDFDKAFETINVKPGISILDIGCGYGNLTLQLAKKGYNVTGIDISEFIINEARLKAAAANCNCTFEAHDFLSFETGHKFDIITDRGFLTVLMKQNKIEALAKVHHLLIPGGCFFLKIDRSQLRKNFISVEDIEAYFSVLDHWKTAYNRSDGMPIPADFFILQRK